MTKFLVLSFLEFIFILRKFGEVQKLFVRLLTFFVYNPSEFFSFDSFLKFYKGSKFQNH